MANPPPLYGHIVGWPPSSRPDADHVWVVEWGKEKLVEVDEEPHLLVPLRKQYTDPYGLQKLQPKEYRIPPPCPLCFKISVSTKVDIIPTPTCDECITISLR